MKTFKEFTIICEETKRTLKDILGPGVPSERSTSTTTLSSLRKKNTSDLAKPKGSGAGVAATPLNKSSFRGRVEAGRRPPNENWADNPNYTGPTTSSSGTRDRMPGTNPSSNPHLSTPAPIFKFIKPKAKSTPTTSKIKPENPKPKRNNTNFI